MFESVDTHMDRPRLDWYAISSPCELKTSSSKGNDRTPESQHVDDDDVTVSSIKSGLKTRSLGLNTLGTT